MLDAVLGDLNSLSKRVSIADQQRLDAHATSIRAIESGLSPDCSDAVPALGKAMMDMLAMAVACDLTCVLAL